MSAVIFAIAIFLVRFFPSGFAAKNRTAPAREEPIGGSIWSGITHIARSPYLFGLAAAILLYTTTSTWAYFQQTDLAREAKLYVSADQLRSLVSQGFSIGNHTYTHVNCRVLSGDDFDQEIFANQRVLEAIVNRKVRAFSVPYGSSADVSRELLTHLRQSGHEALFLVESLANTAATDYFHLYRVSVTARSDANFFGELEIEPRLRSIRNRLFRQRAKTFQ